MNDNPYKINYNDFSIKVIDKDNPRGNKPYYDALAIYYRNKPQKFKTMELSKIWLLHKDRPIFK